MAESKRTVWPPPEAVYPGCGEQSPAYVDEFGAIDADVYRAAGDLWKSRGEGFALATLRDAHAGLRLMLRAAADVTRRRQAPDAGIKNLPAYLYRSYQRRVLEELEMENDHRRRDLLSVAQQGGEVTPVEDVERKILIQQIEQRMEAPMRELYQYLVLGFDFSEIGRKLGKSHRALKKRFDRHLKRLLERLKSEHEAAARRGRKVNRRSLFSSLSLCALIFGRDL